MMILCVHAYIVMSPTLIVETKVSNVGTDDITITLSWTQQQESSVSYSVSIVPRETLTEGLGQGSRNATVTVAYNTPYIVSIVANLCGHNISSNTTTLNYGEPLEEVVVAVMNAHAPQFMQLSVPMCQLKLWMAPFESMATEIQH